jgi:hypothetical protein
MNKPVAVVVLAKYSDVFKKNILDSSERLIPSTINRILVKDGDEIQDPPGWTVIQGPEKFSMAGNANLGLKAAPVDSDILYCGDDVTILQEGTIEKLQQLAYSDEKIGILSARIIGRGSPCQINPPAELAEIPPIEMWFPCVYIKREVLDKVGYLDEQFNDFGSDDLDFCIRIKQAGYRICVTSKVAVKHGASPEGGPTTFVKNIGVGNWQNQQREAQQKLVKKYGVPVGVLNKVVCSGDVALLDTKSMEFQKKVSAGYRPPSEECSEFLKTRHVFIGTPAYGGNCNINYVNSLLSLINTCHDIGVVYTIAFTQNESLVTRARNQLTDNFLKSEATDLVWIDADIGFDARDIITIMMYDEGVIGLPCSRKNLRVDRVVQAVKKNTEKVYSIEELEELMGEFVLNFADDKIPTSFNLGGLLETKHVGTGLMRIKRETLETIKEKIPNRWIRPMTGEAGSDGESMYMFFQAEPDFDAKEGEIPYYVSEDFSFCQLARKAGVGVYLAPWAKTTHTGSYIFRGNLTATGMAGMTLR